MNRVGVRDFRDHATQYLAGDEVLLIEKRGEPVGIYIPVSSTPRRDRVAAMQQLERAVEEVLEKTGLSEDELADLFDLSKPLPDGIRAARR